MTVVFVVLIIISISIFYIGFKSENKLKKISGVSLFFISVLLLSFNKLGWIGSNKGVKVFVKSTEYKTIIETVSASGKIQPEKEVKISPDVSGEIILLNIKEGDKVKQGQLLLQIKQDTYLSILERAEASLNNSKANLAKSKAQLLESESNFYRNKTLFNSGAISASEFEQIESLYKVAKLNVQSAEYSVTSSQASLREAKEDLNKTSIYSPIDGTISRLNVELGERVVGTMQMAGTEILRLADLDKMEVSVEVNENDINRISLGDSTIIEVDAFLGKKFSGIISEIANSADIDGYSADQVTNFKVKIKILDKVNFLPGMTATVDIQTEVQNNVLAVPIQAVTIREDTSLNITSDKEYVFVYDAGKVKMQEVLTGIQDNENIHVIRGISDSIQIVTGPYSVVSKLLKDGQRVSIN